MNKTCRFWVLSFTAASSLVFVTTAGADEISIVHNKQQTLFLSAKSALISGEFQRFKSLADQNKDYILYPYLKFYELSELIASVSDEEIAQFLTTYIDTPLSGLLRYKRLFALGEQKKWKPYKALYTGQKNTTLRCYKLNADLVLNQSAANLNNVLAEAKKLWLVGKKQPKECIPIFKRLLSGSRITATDLWQRIEMAMDKGQLSLVSQLSKKFNKHDKRLIALWKMVYRNPEKGLKSKSINKKSPIVRKIIVQGVKKIARVDASKARLIWMKKSSQHGFDRDQLGEMRRYIALRSAFQFNPNAYSRLLNVKAKWVNENVRLWRARTAMRGGKWSALVKSINGFKPYERKQIKWQYWLARAHDMLGAKKVAKKIFTSIADKTNYYGFLAADHLGIKYKFDTQPSHRDEERIASLIQLPGLKRARELYVLAEITDARREWNRVMSKSNKNKLKAAALIAHEWQWHDVAIATIAQAGNFQDFDVRFPTPFRELIFLNAETYQMNPSLIFGVARRESAFNHTARSSAGALGLMQLLPGTARLQSKSMGLARPSNNDLLKSDHNILLGSAYLNRLLLRFSGNRVLAVAAYNAGPNRVDKWIPKNSSIATDIWIDTVPYKETREYVRAVIAYSTIFDWKLKKEIVPVREKMRVVGKT